MSAPLRPIFTLTFRPEPGVDAIRALRALLKAALRKYGLKCVAANERIDNNA
jgi:hypothetical protein